MTLPLEDWSESLTERILSSLSAGEIVRALELTSQGDGRARNLASEFRLMHKGLGITLRVTLDLLDEDQPLTQDTKNLILRKFYTKYLSLAVQHLRPSAPAVPRFTQDAFVSSAEVTALLEWVEAQFSRDQSARAEEIRAGIERQSPEVVQLLLEKRDEGFRPIHDAIIEVLAEVFSLVVDNGGNDALYRFQLRLAEGQRAGIDAWDKSGSRQTAEAFAHLLVQHMGSFDVEELEDRYLITQQLCGSGGQLIRKGRYQGDESLRIVPGPSEVTGGHQSLPAYCTHCPMWNTIAPKIWYGHEHVRFVDPAKPDGSCTLAVMKFDV